MERIQMLMEKLGCSEEEAKSIILDDYNIDRHNADPYPLTPKQKQVERSARQVARKVDAYGKSSKRERKKDIEKAEIINLLRGAIELFTGSEVEVANPEREFTFRWHDRKFKITLSAPRS